MTAKRKSNNRSTMISARLPKDTVARVDFVVRNIDNDDLVTRSAALQAALETWLPPQEKRLVELGLTPPKKAR